MILTSIRIKFVLQGKLWQLFWYHDYTYRSSSISFGMQFGVVRQYVLLIAFYLSLSNNNALDTKMLERLMIHRPLTDYFSQDL